MKNTTTTPNDSLLYVDKDSDGKITGWGITVKTTDAIEMFNKIIREATKVGDSKRARGARKLLQSMPDPRTADEVILYYTQKSFHDMPELKYTPNPKTNS